MSIYGVLCRRSEVRCTRMNRVEEFVGNKQIYLDINSDIDKIQPIAHALSSKLRLKIIHLIGRRSMSVNELAQALGEPLSTISLNLSVLEKAGLVYTEAQSGVRGILKLCSRMSDRITVNLVTSIERPHYIGEMAMPIGCYSAAGDIHPTCGLASRGGTIGVEDNPLVFFLPERFDAQLIWFRQGYLEYTFPTLPLRGVALESMEVSFEACSEAMNYRNDWESDISLWINSRLIGSWHSPGDFGGRRGVLNPEWWSDNATQFGHLKTWRIDEAGSFLDNDRVSDAALKDLRLQESDFFTLRVGVSPDAQHVGGMNLFGAGFGDYPQHIVVRYAYH